MGWVFLRNEEVDGAGLYADDPGLLSLLASRGWTRHALPTGIDPDDPYAPAALAEILAEGIDTEPILDPDEAGQLRGKELDEALETAGLSKSGTVAEKQARLAEKQARLAEHEAGLATNNSNDDQEEV